jgi:hypothetical protein
VDLRDPKLGKPCWSHHPRGGVVTGFAGPLNKGLYSPERYIASTERCAYRNRGGLSFPDSQVHLGDPPTGAK